MVSTVQGIGASIADMSRANADMGRAAKIRRIDDLRMQRYRVALARSVTSSPDEAEVHDTFIQELSEQIDKAEREVYDNPAATPDGAPAGTNNSNRTSRGRRSRGNPVGSPDQDDSWNEYDRTRGGGHPNNRGLLPSA